MEEEEQPLKPKKTSWKYLPLNEKTGISLALLFFGYPLVRKDDEDIVVCLLCKKPCNVSNYEGMKISIFCICRKWKPSVGGT